MGRPVRLPQPSGPCCGTVHAPGNSAILRPRGAGLRLHRAVIHAPVAQLDRVLPSEGRGRGFESRRAHHFFVMPPMLCV